MRDLDIRQSLLTEIHRQFEADPDTLVLQELGVCQGFARVDLAVVNGSLHGYEIKSEHDTLARLPGQTEVYNRALDFVTIVTSANYTDKVLSVVPGWWGVRNAKATKLGTVRIDKIRNAKRNPNIDAFSLVQFLWREEALEELEIRGLAAGLRNKPRIDLWNRLAKELSLKELSAVVRHRLKTRADWRPEHL